MRKLTQNWLNSVFYVQVNLQKRKPRPKTENVLIVFTPGLALRYQVIVVILKGVQPRRECQI